MKLLIAGSRKFHDYALLEKEVLRFIKKHRQNKEDIEIISGHAFGADILGECFARKFKIPALIFPADWALHGRKAGHLRNEKMAEVATHAIVFWDQESPGTRNMVGILKSKNIPHDVILYERVEE